jgi:vacuolar-type H+-ATPase subunit H
VVTDSDTIRKLQSEEKRVQQDRNKAKQRMTQLIQEANEDLPAGLAALEESKAVCGKISTCIVVY